MKNKTFYMFCETVKDKIHQYISNHFVADKIVKTDMNSIVHAMEEGVRIGQEKEPFEIEKNRWYVCIKDFYAGGKKQCSKGDLVLAKGGMYMMGIDGERAAEHFFPVNDNAGWTEYDEKMLKRCVALVRGCEIDFCNGDDNDSEWLKLMSKKVMLSSHKDKQDIFYAVEVAKQLYEQFVSELTTALFNTNMYAKGALSCAVLENNKQKIATLRARIDTLDEILFRIEKEKKLEEVEIEQAFDVKKIYNIEKQIKFNKNLDAEKIIPDDKIRGRRCEPRLFRFRGKIADLLEAYGNEGFNLGIKYMLHKDKDEIPEFNITKVKKIIGLDDAHEEMEDLKAVEEIIK